MHGHSTKLLSVLALSAAGVAGGCSGLEPEAIESDQSAILQGTPVDNLAPTGVVHLRRPDPTVPPRCTGTVYNQYWVLTSAHCFVDLDTSPRDGVITLAEGAGLTVIDNVVDSNGTLRTLTAWQIQKPPRAVFGQGGDVDVAMVFIQPTSLGASVAQLSSLRYTNGSLNIYSGTNASLLNRTVTAFGYGPSFMGDPTRILRSGLKTVSAVDGVSYSAIGQTGCPRDSGGPDYLAVKTVFGVTRYWLTGVHSTGSTDCVATTDGQPGAQSFRDWVISTGGTCPNPTRSGRCAFL